MQNSRRIVVLTVMAGIAFCISGCLTSLVVYKSAGPDRGRAEISRLRAASSDGRELSLLLDVQAPQQDEPRTVLLRVPIDAIGSQRKSEKKRRTDLGELKLKQPPLGCLVEPADLSGAGASIQPRYLNSVTQLSVVEYVRELPEGVYVLVVDYCSYPEPCANLEGQGNGLIPPDGSIVLVARSPGAEPQTHYLSGFEQAPEPHRAWLLLTPLSVVGDIVTSPLQFIYVLMVDC